MKYDESDKQQVSEIFRGILNELSANDPNIYKILVYQPDSIADLAAKVVYLEKENARLIAVEARYGMEMYHMLEMQDKFNALRKFLLENEISPPFKF